MSEPRTPEAEREALEQMIRSDGWTILREIVDTAYGSKQQLAEIDAVMGQLRPGDDERAVVTQIRAAGKAAFDVLARVEARARTLAEAEEKKQAKGPFPSFRRGPRR